MTAIKTSPSSAVADEASAREGVRSPSATVQEAKTRFVSELTKGVDTLLEKGHGRERVASELLSGIADGCSPDEEEIFQTMETFGLSMEDATKVMTVSTAFRKAKSIKGGSAAAIDELSSRLNLADLSHRGRGASRSPSPSPSATSVTSTQPGAIKMTELARNESVESLQSHKNNTNTQMMAKKGSRPNMMRANNKHHQQQQQGGRGRKRALAEKTPEKRDSNVMIEKEQQSKSSKAGAEAAAADLEVKEKMLNAKLSKATAEGKKPKSSVAGGRAKSPEGGLAARGKRASATVLHVDDQAAMKRPRTRSQTEESIPDI